MAQIRDLTIATKTYTALSGASATSPAIWGGDPLNAAKRVGRARLQVLTKDNGTKTARRIVISYVLPCNTDTTGMPRDRMIAELSVLVPNGASESEISTFTAHIQGIVANPDIAQAITLGFAPV